MPWGRFLLFNCLGAVTWVTAISLLAYLFAVNLPILVKILGRSSLALLAIVVAIALFVYIKRRYAAYRAVPPV